MSIITNTIKKAFYNITSYILTSSLSNRAVEVATPPQPIAQLHTPPDTTPQIDKDLFSYLREIAQTHKPDSRNRLRNLHLISVPSDVFSKCILEKYGQPTQALVNQYFAIDISRPEDIFLNSINISIINTAIQRAAAQQS